MHNAFLLHNDLFFRNVMLRRIASDHFNYDHPVVIDSGMGYLYKSEEEEDKEENISDLRKSAFRARKNFVSASWHIPPVYFAHYAPRPPYGLSNANGPIEDLSD